MIPYIGVAGLSILYATIKTLWYGNATMVTHVIAREIVAMDTLYEGTIFDMWVKPTWFLLTLFWARIIFYYLSNTGKWLLPLCMILSIGMIIIHPYVPTPFCIGRGLEALIFMACGYTFKKYNIPMWFKIVLIGCWPIAICLGGVDMCAFQYNCIPIDIMGACGGTLAVYYISRLIEKLLKGRFLGWCGRNSLIILCVHSFKLPNILHPCMKYGVTLFVSWVYVNIKSRDKKLINDR